LDENHTQKPKNVDYFRVPRPLWRRLRRHLPKEPEHNGPGRKRADPRRVINGIWYVLWTGCQWKAVKRDWFGVCSTTIHDRFQEWQRCGLFEQLMREFVQFYDQRRGIEWTWQAIDSKSCPAPLGGQATGKSPVDRSKRGSKIHILVDGRGAPLAVYITGANIHDKWLVDEVIISIVVPRICVLTEAMTTRMSISLSSRNAMWPILDIAVAAVSLFLRTVLFPVKRSSPLGAGSSSARSVGSPSVAACACVGAKNLKTGWPLSNSPVLTFLWISLFTDRY
jgi:transposase